MSADEHAATVRQDFIAARNYSMVGDIARGTELLEQPRPPTTGRMQYPLHEALYKLKEKQVYLCQNAEENLPNCRPHRMPV